uniref:Uncharacterized protein n=1 Tax=Anguilla anguilla TaxID=7936 RepID=A0A0E9WC13_ANGAN
MTVPWFFRLQRENTYMTTKSRLLRCTFSLKKKLVKE